VTDPLDVCASCGCRRDEHVWMGVGCRNWIELPPECGVGHQSMLGLVSEAPPTEGWDPISSQVELQRKIAARNGHKIDHVDQHLPAADLHELLTRIRWNKEQYDREHVEMLDQLPSKSWKTYGEMHPLDLLDQHPELVLELKYEVIDKWHFLLNEAIALGMDWDEFLTIFRTKQVENHRRQDEGY